MQESQGSSFFDFATLLPPSATLKTKSTRLFKASAFHY